MVVMLDEVPINKAVADAVSLASDTDGRNVERTGRLSDSFDLHSAEYELVEEIRGKGVGFIHLNGPGIFRIAGVKSGAFGQRSGLQSRPVEVSVNLVLGKILIHACVPLPPGAWGT